MTTPSPGMPLDGFRVIEIGHSVAAPYAALILAELGAEVIKIERPGKGDDARAWGPPFHDDMATMFHALNRGKKSVEVDLKSTEGIATIKALARDADAVIQNLRPGLADKLGIGGEALTVENERLVYASIHAFGSKGPLADRPGYDPLMQAFGGIMSVTGEEGRPSVRVGTSIIDMGTGMWTAMGVVAALLKREQSGRGGIVDASLFETALGWMVYHLPAYTRSRELPAKAGSGTTMIVPYQAFETADGELVIAAGNDNLFKRLSAVLDRTEWAEDLRYATNPKRVESKAELCAAIEAITRTQQTSVWMERLEAAGVPCAPVQTIDQVAAHPQTEALDILRGEADDALQFFALPLHFDGRRPNVDGPAPPLGRDNDLARGWPGRARSSTKA